MASAQDVTPLKYHFYQVPENTVEELGIFATEMYPTGNWNLNNYAWGDKDGGVGFAQERYNDGFVCWAPGGALSEDFLKNVQTGLTLVNFGGEIGKALAITYSGSKVNEALAALGENAPQVKESSLQGQQEWFWFLSPYTETTPNVFKISIQYNVFANDLTDPAATLGGNMYINDNENNVHPADDNAKGVLNNFKKVASCREEEVEDPETGDFDLGFVWDPTMWRTMTWYANCPVGTEVPRIKMNLNNQWSAAGSFTLFIRDITITNEGEMASYNPDKPQEHVVSEPEYLGYDFSTSGIVDVMNNDNNAPEVYYNLQGIQVQNPENGVFIVKKGNAVKKVRK